MILSPLIDRAIGFAARAHEGQHRKTSKIPYIAHPVGVAMILQGMGCSETIVAAGLLHDIVEDTPFSLAEIRQAFGEEVAAIVAGCTEPKGKWEARKLHTIKIMRDAPLAIKLVAAADKYHNLRHTLLNRGDEGAPVWNRFSRGKEQQAWYYRCVTESILANVVSADAYPIFALLQTAVAELFADIPSQPPLA